MKQAFPPLSSSSSSSFARSKVPVDTREMKIRKLQQKMEGLPSSSDTQKKTTSSTVRRKGKQQESEKPTATKDPDQILFDKINGEIEERKQFMDKMRSLNQLTSELETQMRNEIQERAKELTLLDNHIRSKRRTQ
eukprot:TRINITY_DN6353_c0_g1_i1.p1 TRINITY_DN6353_c0_g1~~TRINITY_DN6353_c0_g1_i1.p1  ORF type:complete len:147 (-),score=58.94 TRINITY_DN6353_c0_g1_i1:194-598(-)